MDRRLVRTDDRRERLASPCCALRRTSGSGWGSDTANHCSAWQSNSLGKPTGCFNKSLPVISGGGAMSEQREDGRGEVGELAAFPQSLLAA